MNAKNIFTKEFNIQEFNIFLSDITKQEIDTPYDITFLSQKYNLIEEVLEYKTFTDSEDEELKVYIIKTNNISDSKEQRDKLIRKFLLDSYINNALVATYNQDIFTWIITYYKVVYVKNKDTIVRKISFNSKYSYTLTEKPNKKLINEIEKIEYQNDFTIYSLYNIFNNDEIKDIKPSTNKIQINKNEDKKETIEKPVSKLNESKYDIDEINFNKIYQKVINEISESSLNVTLKKISNKQVKIIHKKKEKITITKEEDFIEIEVKKPIPFKIKSNNWIDVTENEVYINIEKYEHINKALNYINKILK